MTTYRLSPGMPLAMHPSAIRRDADGLFISLLRQIPKSTIDHGIATIYVHGELVHHREDGPMSYEHIRCEISDFMQNPEVKSIVLCVDSPGGFVSGLNETISEIKKLRQQYDKPICAYVDEMAASAAYALCCACDEIYAPPSAIIGSIGVISLMVDQVEHDKQHGLNFVTIASGKHKADGHPHVPIRDEAIEAESGRVQEMAAAFFEIVQSARGISIEDIAALEAEIFLGRDAFALDLIDAVSSKRDFYRLLEKSEPIFSSMSQKKRTISSEESIMALKINALIRRTEKLLASANLSESKKKQFRADLDAYKKTKYKLEESETTEEYEDEEEEEETSAGGNDTERDEEVSEGDDDDEDEEEEEEEAKSRASTLRQLESITGVRGSSAVLGVVRSALAKSEEFERISADVRDLRARESVRELDRLIEDGTRAGKFPNQKFIKSIRSQGIDTVKSYLAATAAGTFMSTDRVAYAPASPEDLQKIPVTEAMKKAARMAHASTPSIPYEKFIEDMQKSAAQGHSQGRY